MFHDPLSYCLHPTGPTRVYQSKASPFDQVGCIVFVKPEHFRIDQIDIVNSLTKIHASTSPLLTEIQRYNPKQKPDPL